MANAPLSPQQQQLALLDVDDALLAELLAPLESDNTMIALQPTNAMPELLAVSELADTAATPELPHVMCTHSDATPSSNMLIDEVTASSPLLDEEQLLAETEALLGMIDPALVSIGHLDCRADFTAMEPTSPATPVSVAISNSSVNHSNSSSPAPDSSSGDDTSSAVTTPAQAVDGNQPTKRSRRRGSKPGSMRNPSRERLLDELDYLRKQVVVLETELHEMQQEKQQHQSTQSTTTPSALTVVPKWERIAKRQLASCERATSENKRLRSMLALQRELVAGMEETLYNWQHVTQQSDAIDGSSTAIVATPHKTVHLESGDGLLFEMLVSELDGTYVRADDMLRTAGLDTLRPEPLVRTTVKTRASAAADSVSQSFFEVAEVDVSPFEFEMVYRVARICNERLSNGPDCIRFRGHWSTDGVLTDKYVVQRTLNGADVAVHVLLALKEFRSPSRVIVVWRSLFRCEQHFPDTFVQETGVSVSEPLLSSDEHVAIGTLTKACAHLEPKRFATASTTPCCGPVEDDPMMMLVMDAYHDDMNDMNEMMENLLLEESLKHRGASAV